MKIVIEHEDATASCLGAAPADFTPEAPIAVFTPAGEEIVLRISPERQTMDRWCWAAIAVSLAQYYHARALTQHEIATRVLGFDCSGFSEDAGLKQQCNVNLGLDKVLQSVGCFSHWSPGKPHFERVQFEIANGRPICCRINWYTGDAHYVLINGYRANSEAIHIADPLHGSSVIPYLDFPAKYKGSGAAWTETYWTRKNA